MAAWFPFHNPTTATSSSTGVSPAFELSLTYSKLAILLAPRPKVLVFPKSKKEVGWKLRIRAIEESWREMRLITKNKGKGKQADGWALEEVSEWIISVLVSDIYTPKSPRSNTNSQAPQDALTPSMTPTAYSSMLSLILPLLLLPPTSEIPTTIGQALLSHLSRQGSSSQIRSLGNQFLISLVLAHEVRFPSIPFFIPPQSPLRPGLTTWIENLPKTLWEIGIKDPQGTIKILEFLLIIGQRGKGAFEDGFSIVDGKVFGTVAARLGPWFWLEHPSKGGIKGPWTKLERDVKKLGLDVASIWAEYDGDSSLHGAVGKAVESDEWTKIYWASRSS
jgi:pre-rRNA-processing protein IPI1